MRRLIPLEELTQKFSQASPLTKLDIFKEAAQSLTTYTINRDPKYSQIMPRVIQVYKALIAVDTTFMGDNVHVLYSGLAYALMDQASPRPEDFRQAIANLDEAIKRRDQSQSQDLFYDYELNRARARILLDPTMSKQDQTLTLADLKLVAQSAYLTEAVLNEDLNAPVKAWLDQNQFSLAALSETDETQASR